MKKIVAVGLTVTMLGVTCVSPGFISYADEIAEEVDQDVPEAESPEQENEIDKNEIQTDDAEQKDAEIEQNEEQTPSVVYTTHVQSIGWQDDVKDGELAGTSGRGLRMEGVKIHLENVEEGQGEIEYSAHVQSIGWQDYVSEGEVAGTTGRKLRVEAIKIRLTGELAEKYDVYYRTHIQSYGWLGWAKNGAGSGSMGLAKRMEAVQICLVKKGDAAPGDEENSYVYHRVEYQAHSQSHGWLSKVYDDAVGGVTGQSKRLEALTISLPEQEYEGDIEYRSFVQSYGWQDWKKNGEMTGSTGSGKRLEAIEIRLTGELAEHFDVYYSVHMAKVGWSAYAKSGETAGSTDLSKKIEAIQIKLVKKGVEEAPNTTGVRYIHGLERKDFSYCGNIQDYGTSSDQYSGEILGRAGESKKLQSLSIFLDNGHEFAPKGDVLYSIHASKVGWMDEVSSGTTAERQDGPTVIEAFKIRLTGELEQYYDIYYRAHIQKYGWLGWAKNGQVAGSTKIGYAVEALEIRLVSKDAAAPGENSNYYTEEKYRVYQNPSQYYQIKNKITLSGGGYNLDYGFEGIKVRKVIQKLGLGNGVGMGGAFYGTTVKNAVRNFQKKNGLPQTGIVDKLTWNRMGFNDVEWESYGAYVSPVQVDENSTRSDHIEAMISRARDYLGDDYVIGASGAPGLGIDCSGLVMQALYAAGLDTAPITPVSHAQPGHEYESRNMWNSSKFKHVPYSQRQRGDLIFYQNSSGVVIHVAIYLGNNQVIEAWPNKVVIWPIRNGSRSNIKGVARPFV